ncbi:MAG TPA: regulatory protein RecX [Elusimicrobiota bacterium]|nr:regulatory protein RecX [Elusimicrobiota bacterium]
MGPFFNNDSKKEDRSRKPSTAKDPQAAMDYALLLLKYRGRAEKEIRSRLRRKKFPDDIIGQTVTRLMEVGLLNDAALAETWVDSRLRAGEGPYRVRQKLLSRGLDKGVVDETLKNHKDRGQEDEAAREFLAKKFKTMGRGNEKTLYHRLGSALARRGFSPDCIHDVLKEFLSERKRTLTNDDSDSD